MDSPGLGGPELRRLRTHPATGSIDTDSTGIMALDDDLLVAVLTSGIVSRGGLPTLRAADLARLACVSRRFANGLVQSAAKVTVGCWVARPWPCASLQARERARTARRAHESWLAALRAIEALPPVHFIATGAADLDRAIGGGLATGSITEVLGARRSGKSSLAHATAVTAQLGGGLAMVIDLTGSFDPRYLLPVADRHGLDRASALRGVHIAHVAGRSTQEKGGNLLRLLGRVAPRMHKAQLDGEPFKLLCVESACHLHHESRVGLSNERDAVMKALRAICDEFHVAVIVTVQLPEPAKVSAGPAFPNEKHLGNLLTAELAAYQRCFHCPDDDNVITTRIWLQTVTKLFRPQTTLSLTRTVFSASVRWPGEERGFPGDTSLHAVPFQDPCEYVEATSRLDIECEEELDGYDEYAHDGDGEVDDDLELDDY